MPVELTARFRLVSPAFIQGVAGAPSERPEIRLPSLKGVLRFWWRATMGRTVSDATQLRKMEAMLFGSTETRSRVRLDLEPHNDPTILSVGSTLEPKQRRRRESLHGIRYLGYGLIASAGPNGGNLTRSALASGCRFSLHIRILDPLSRRARGRLFEGVEFKNIEETLQHALMAMGLLGGIGARSRRGFGSLCLEELRLGGDVVFREPKNFDEYSQALVQLYKEAGGRRKAPWTALSNDTRHVLVAGESNEHVCTLLDRVGHEFLRFRSWGREGRIPGGVAERNFPHDHDLMQRVAREGHANRMHPQRVVFGLPHNYHFTSIPKRQRRATPSVSVRGALDRRASPLMIHVHECGSRPLVVVSFFRSRFLPANTGLQVGKENVPLTPEAKLFEPADGFLDRLVTHQETLKPRGRWFARVQEVKHV